MTTAAVGNRYRIVTRHDSGEEHISAAVFSHDEAVAQLALEATMHEIAGWDVLRIYASQDGPVSEVLATVGRRSRRIFARAFTPHNDTPEGGDAR